MVLVLVFNFVELTATNAHHSRPTEIDDDKMPNLKCIYGDYVASVKVVNELYATSSSMVANGNGVGTMLDLSIVPI